MIWYDIKENITKIRNENFGDKWIVSINDKIYEIYD